VTGWTVIVPVKPWRLAKSRLRLEPSAREALARAFAIDVIEALNESASVGSVVVVSAEEDLRPVARRLGFELLADTPLRSLDPLNDAVSAGRHWAARRRPDAPVAALVSDLPALTGAVVTATLELALHHRTAFVPDPSGTGTTMVASTAATSMVTAFGPASARHHGRLGLACLSGADSRIRRDVDDTSDLEAAVVLGLRRHTAGVVAGLRSCQAAGPADRTVSR
jgi:2-phospho-L-lactate guanylyltransferase